MTRSLADLAQGTRVFIDANIFVYHVSADSRLNQVCADFLRRVEQGLLAGITSAAVVQEISHRVMMAEALLACPHVKSKDLVRHLKTHPNIVKTLLINQGIASTIASMNIEILPVSASLIARSQQMKTRYGFLSNDALTLQIMSELEVRAIATNDSDFERVDAVTVYKP
ncbi:MAG: type II toxin-antitoxin system VapC family toxin [Nitrospira sp.]